MTPEDNTATSGPRVIRRVEVIRAREHPDAENGVALGWQCMYNVTDTALTVD
jgi:hypothetical protein